ncbi:zinc finger BED domain-containing protein RICESLEEPER 1-like [Abeliophyllum distichum]|uniref:Zinc finger BED domain-containing protein RICESLEEPER 1-like n=1 Tax=Abeliophyllum distichum TaxID=126358 RepID=A0ABD1REQ8_9LAMI
MAIYDWYVYFEGSTQISEETRDVDSTSGFSSASHIRTTSSGSSIRMSKFKEKFAAKDTVELKNDMERNLLEPREDVDNEDFDVLNWWRVHESKYTTLSKIAKDVLAI